MGLFGRMTRAAGKAAKNEVKRTVKRNARKTVRTIRKRLDNRGKVSTSTRKATPRKRVVKKLPAQKKRGGWRW